MEQKLNCWPGCLAIVKSDLYCVPRDSIIKCIEFYRGLTYTSSDPVPKPEEVGTWLVEYRGSLIDPKDGAHWNVNDEHLRPLRDDEGQDEMLRIAGLPAQDKQVV